MKFVCENCKAKYQIGDDKVAGKTLRMKCRRCGHMIQVSATVTESSVSKLNPAAPERRPSQIPSGPAPPPPAPAVPDFSANDGNGNDDDGTTVVRPSPLFLRTTGASPAVRPPAPAAAGRPAPPARPSTPIPGAAQRSLSGLSGGLSAPSPRPSAVGPRPTSSQGGLRSGAGSLTARAAATVAGGGSVAPASAGLSGGFSRAITAPPAVPSAGPPTEDWYVGVGGVPLGPVRLSVIREKASAGAVDGDSLVWREGFEEWQPLKTFPALLELVDEARGSRASRPLPTPVPPQPTPAPPRATNGASPQRDSGLPSAPRQNGGVPAAAASVPFSLVTPPGTPGPLDAVSDPFAAPKADPFAAPKPDASREAALDALAKAPLLAEVMANDRPSFGGGLSVNGFAGDAAAHRPSFVPAPVSVVPERKRGIHPMAWAFVAMCAAFGGVAAWAVFLRKPETVIIQGTAVQAQGTSGLQQGPAPPPPPTDLPSGTPQASSGPVGSNPIVSSGAGLGSRPAKPETTSGAPASTFDSSGFASGGGPTTGPDSNGGPAKGKLSQGEIEGVVTRGKPSITRRCWNPAYDARDANAPKSAKVNVSITVAPNGSVSGASASGGDQFPSLASCVASSVKSWSFPASEGPTTVNIPFSFIQQ